MGHGCAGCFREEAEAKPDFEVNHTFVSWTPSSLCVEEASDPRQGGKLAVREDISKERFGERHKGHISAGL